MRTRIIEVRELRSAGEILSRALNPVDQHSPEPVRDLAERLREIMFAAGYRTAAHLAEDSGVNASTLSEALSGTRAPSSQTLKKVLEACGLVYDRVWAGRQERAKNAEAAEKANSRRSRREQSSPNPPRQHSHSGHHSNRPTAETHLSASQVHSLEPPLGNLPPEVRGRSSILTRLREHLDAYPDKFVVLHGMGGCGKTTVALSIAQTARTQGFDIFWVKASKDNLDSAMRQIARRLGAEHEEIEEAWGSIGNGPDLLWQLLNSSQRRWLLILDEVDEPELIGSANGQPGDGTGWIRASRNGLTIVTTRLGDPEIWGNSAEFHAIEPLTPDDGAEVLLDLANEAGSRSEAQYLSARLGGLPLALRLAGSQLSRATRGAGLLRRGRDQGRVRDFTSYLAALDDTGIEYLDRANKGALSRSSAEQLHRHLISRTWEISLDLLETQGFPEARTFMRLLSCFGAYPIPVDILDSEGLKRHNAFPQDFSIDRLELIIEALQTLSLLDIIEVSDGGHETQPAITVHNLVLEANRNHLAIADRTTQAKIARTAVELLEVATETPPEDRANHHWWSLLYPHVMQITCSTEAPSREIAEPLLQVGLRNFSYMHLAFRGPVREAATALRAISESLETNHALRLAARHRYAFARLSGMAAAMEFRELYKQEKEILGEFHPETLMSHHNWAEHLADSGNFKEAERELRKVLQGRREILGKSHPYTLSTHRVLIDILQAQKGGRDRAETEWEEVYDSIHSAENPGLADLETLHLLGHWLDKKERWTEAEECYRTIIDALDSTPTEGQHFCESMRHCLAQNLIRQGRLDESANTYRERVKLLEQTRDVTDENLISMRHEYADLLVDLGRLEESELLMRSVLEVRLARDHRVMDRRLLSEAHCLVHLLERRENREEAVSTARRLVQLPKDELVAWSKFSQIRQDMLCMCRTLSDAGNYDESILGLEALMEGVPPDSREAHSIQRALALTQHISGRLTHSSCEEKLLGIIESLEEKFGTDDEEIGRTRDVLMGLRGDPKKPPVLDEGKREPETGSTEDSEPETRDDR